MSANDTMQTRAWVSALKRAFSQPKFVVAVIVMGLCAATLNTAAGFLRIHFEKKRVDLRPVHMAGAVGSLKDGVPAKVGFWVMVSKDQAIDPEIQQVLATNEYVFRDYVDSRVVSQAKITAMQNADPKERQEMIGEVQKKYPAGVMTVAVTYYTGLVDTVAHVPERCYVADGFEVKQFEEVEAHLGNYPNGQSRDIRYRFLGFEDAAGVGSKVERVARNVGYVFHCNGEYVANPYDVRRSLQNLFEPYGYYAKIELMTVAILHNSREGIFEANKQSESKLAMEDFMTNALPEIEKCLPDWAAVHKK